MSDAKPTAGKPAAPEPTRLESAESMRRASSAPPTGTVMEKAPAAPAGTRLESVEDIRRAAERPPAAVENAPLRNATRLESADEVRNALGRTPTSIEAAPSVPFRPARRPPQALLTICDDGATNGEIVRLRGDRTLIGRSEGDVRIPHDAMMSSRHAEIVRDGEPGGWRWTLIDGQSKNGTFVRVASAPLKHGTEILIGSTVLRFEDAALNLPGAVPEGAGSMPTKTQGWATLKPTDLKASLVRIQDAAVGVRYFLDAAEQWLGRNAVAIALTDDVQVDPRHARIVKDAKGAWSIIDADSKNGVWLRVERRVVDGACEFQLGEQRFQLTVG